MKLGRALGICSGATAVIVGGGKSALLCSLGEDLAGKMYADKPYADAGRKASLKENHALELLTPRKKHKSDTLISGDTFSAFVGSIRQPIECFFNWLNRQINRAVK